MKARLIFAITLLVFLPTASHAINIEIDYTYDSAGFFNNPTAKASLEAAAGFLSEVITDTFDPISTPAPFVNQDATYDWSWTAEFNHPGTGNTISLSNLSVNENQYLIYAGARNLSGNTLGVGGGGGYQLSGSGSYYPSDLSQIESITNDFFNSVQTRGESGGYAGWGGSLTFDTNSNWNYDHTTSPQSAQNDFYSVAIHELVHALGIGGSDQWSNLISGGFFTGINARNAYGGNSVPVSAGGNHWAEGTTSRVYGGTATQEAAMDPNITVGTRKYLTAVDAGALVDIGWTLVEPTPTVLAGDYNGDGTVDAADYTVYRDNFGSTSQLAADGSGNGVIDLDDYNLWVASYGNSSSTSSATTVPEPSSLILGSWLLAIFMLAQGPRFVRTR